MELIDKVRRKFLKQTTGLTIGFLVTGLTGCGKTEEQIPEVTGSRTFIPNPWVNIGRDGTVTIHAPVDELGQGSMTALPLIFAEEMDADWDHVRIELSPPNEDIYGNPDFMGKMYAVESVAVSGYFNLLRRFGAQTRHILLMNAAEKWQVPVDELTTLPGTVVHIKSNRTLSFGEIAAFGKLPATLPDIKDSDLKSPDEFRLIGHSVPRRDVPDKITGKSDYSIDQILPDMVYATAVRAPVMGAVLTGIDDASARNDSNVVDILPRKHSVVIAANNFPAAFKARKKVNLEWGNVGNVNKFDSDIAMEDHTRLASDLQRKGEVWKEQGNIISEFNSAQSVIARRYQSEYVYHAQIEPLNATVWVKNGGQQVEAWVGTQAPAVTARVIARCTGVEPEQVILHRSMVGGAFGRRAVNEMDFVEDAAWLSKKLGRPVKLIWSREDDVASGWFKPMTGQFLRAVVNGNGKITAWHHRIASQEPLKTAEPLMYKATGERPVLSMSGSHELLYDIPNSCIEYLETEPGIRTYALLGVGNTPNKFAMESFIDEIATDHRIDPIEFRTRNLKSSPGILRILNAVTDMASWQKPRGNGRALGIAIAEYHKTLLAGAAEISVEKNGIKVHEFWAAIDPGIAVQPDNIRAQVTGAIVFGLGNALTERITFKNGLVQQSNFHDYLIPRMRDVPEIHVKLLADGDAPSAVGQTAAVLVAPAIANAFASLTGKRLRHMPFTPERVRIALDS